jgi:hypothetical protein
MRLWLLLNLFTIRGRKELEEILGIERKSECYSLSLLCDDLNRRKKHTENRKKEYWMSLL